MKKLEYLSSCQLCPHMCRVNRLRGEKGFCKAGKDIRIYSYQMHSGEEPPISGCNGSGTIFFSHCNGRCVYCQNYKFSQLGEGRDISEEELAAIMINLQEKGVHNINLVTPTHYSIQIIAAIKEAKDRGLRIPIVYNTNTYERKEIIRLLDGLIDIYLPDIKYSNDEMAMKYSSMMDYVFYSRSALKEMYRQVRDLVLENNIAKRGLLVRHLVLPNNISGTRESMDFLANRISKDVCLSLMCQYFPVYDAKKYKELARTITAVEYENAINSLCDSGLRNGWCQEQHTGKDREMFLGEGFAPM